MARSLCAGRWRLSRMKNVRIEDDMDELNERQREFARLLVSGVSKGDAYRRVFKSKDLSYEAARKRGQRLSQKEAVVAFCDTLRREMDDAAVLSRQERMEMLSQKARQSGAGGNTGDMVRCIAELNKMDGAYAPEEKRVEVSTGFGAILEAVGKGVPEAGE